MAKHYSHKVSICWPAFWWNDRWRWTWVARWADRTRGPRPATLDSRDHVTRRTGPCSSSSPSCRSAVGNNNKQWQRYVHLQTTTTTLCRFMMSVHVFNFNTEMYAAQQLRTERTGRDGDGGGASTDWLTCRSTPLCASTFGHGFLTLPSCSRMSGTTS